MFERVAGALHAITPNSDWFTELSSSLLIGQSNCFDCGFTTLDWKPLHENRRIHHLKWQALLQENRDENCTNCYG